MLIADPSVQPFVFPADAMLERSMLYMDPGSVLEMCREELPDSRSAEDWQACRMIEALYHPGRYVRAAYALLADATCPPERYWPEGRIVYLQSPVRTPVSRRGTVLDAHGRRFEAYLFPEDRRLRGLRRFTGRPQAAELWQQWLDASGDGFRIDADSLRRAMIRYVPEQKWVARLRCRGTQADSCEAGKRSVAVRAGSASTLAAVCARHLQLGKASGAGAATFVVPRLVGSAPGLAAVEWLKGAGLVETLQAQDPAPVMAAVTAALRSFHGSVIADLPDVTPRSLFLRAAHAVHDLKWVRPELGLALEAVLRVIRARMAKAGRGAGWSPVTLHNDLHWNQVRFAGNHVQMLDLERMGRGDPLIDVANFATQLRLLSHRQDVDVDAASAEAWASSFLEAWQRAAGGVVNAERFGAYAALSALELARGMMRHLRPGWGALTSACVRFAEGALA